MKRFITAAVALSSTGELTITTNKGRAVTALVTDDTHLRCGVTEDAPTATISRRGRDRCTADALKAGDDVSRASVDLTADDATWTKVAFAAPATTSG